MFITLNYKSVMKYFYICEWFSYVSKILEMDIVSFERQSFINFLTTIVFTKVSAFTLNLKFWLAKDCLAFS